MKYESTIRAFQGVLTSFSFKEGVNFPEEFAIQRFLKKMERPDDSKQDDLSAACFERWVKNDESLPKIVMPPTGWYKARLLIHKWVKESLPKAAPIDFPKGSEFFSTRGANSIEARLCASRWSCTPDNFDAFCVLAYRHKAIRRAVRRRYTKWYRSHDFDVSQKIADVILYKGFLKREPDCKNIGFQIFCWKLARVTTFVQGSRFSTVPKNNEKVRPINIEPFGNILVQRFQGNRIRALLKAQGIDLDTLAEEHGRRLTSRISTIDLSDASDSISVDLVRFLLPPWLFEELMHCRSPMTLGLDGNYYIPRKISSMGCGFTFELMTLILTALGRVFDPDSSVFGDDIIISNGAAADMIHHMERVGLKVNKDKTFINSKFRESCGANFHEDFGYIKSFDFLYPENIHDCAVCYNKAKTLSQYYDSFRNLEKTLRGFIPKALHGGPFKELKAQTDWSSADPVGLSGYFMAGGSSGSRNNRLRKIERIIAERYHYPLTSVEAFIGFKYIPDERSKCLRHLSARKHWAKYEMYLYSGRRAKDVVTGCGRWVEKTFIRIDQQVTQIADITE